MTKNQPAGRGALFKNDKKGIEKRPDYTGTLKIWDKEFNVSAWVQTSKNGIKYLGLAVNERSSAPNNAPTPPSNTPASAPAQDTSEDDNIPF